MAAFGGAPPAESLLIDAPESGMGFQIFYYRNDLLLALNATIVVPLYELLQYGRVRDEIAALFATGEELRPRLEPFELSDSFTIAFTQLATEGQQVPPGWSPPGVSSAPPPSVIPPTRPHSYYRFCAAPRDKRVDNRGNFLPDTYATTFTDLPFAPSGFAAVGRYALPTPASARFVFQITTFDTPSLIGTATPNFGQAGGGVEVHFHNGAKNGAGLSFMIPAG